MPAAKPIHLETPAEELASSITHALGGLLAVAALTLLVVSAAESGDARRVVAVAVYGATLVFMYVASTAYHLVRPAAGPSGSCGSSTTAASTC